MIYIPGLVAIIVFYIMILLVGIWAARKSRNRTADMTECEDIMLAGRNIGLVVGIFTMTATWVGGGYINGTAENTYQPNFGLIWCQAPIGYAASLVIGGLFFAKRMRSLAFVTMLDPFQNKFGERMCGLLFIPALLGEVFWTAAILSALGATLGVIVDIKQEIAIIVSACIALLYTLFGGLYSVAYTDVVQLFCIFIGLWISLPFAMMNKATVSITSTWDRWKGHVETDDISMYVDNMLMLTFGGIPWQVYFQRVLSCKSAGQARILSLVASFGCIIMGIPSVLMGAVGASTGAYFPVLYLRVYTGNRGVYLEPHSAQRKQGIQASNGFRDYDWNMTDFKDAAGSELHEDQAKLVLPLVLRYLCPNWVSFIGLGAVSAAVMSSSDSSVLSAASMFARNVVKPVFWQSATERQIIWVMRGSIFVVGAFSCVLAIYIKSIYGLWYLCSDLIYVILFPQLICVLYVKFSNTYGSLLGYLVGLFVRITAGESMLGLPPLFIYPNFYEHPTQFYQRFPCKTLAMICSFVTTVLVSYLTDVYLRGDSRRLKYDFFHCYKQRTSATGSVRIGNRFNRPSIRTTKFPIVITDPDFGAEEKVANEQSEEVDQKTQPTELNTIRHREHDEDDPAYLVEN